MKTYAVALLATTTLAIKWGENNQTHTTYEDVEVKRPYTVDDSTYKTITNEKTRQEATNVTEKRTDTVYEDVYETQQRNWIEDSVENRPQ